MRNHLLYIGIILLIVSSCKSKKVTTDIQRETTSKDTREVRIVTDTIFKDRVITKTLPVYSETIIESPCDENGNIKPINTVIGSGGNRSSISTLNGQLIVKQYIDSTNQIKEELIRVKTTLDSVMKVNATLVENRLTVQEKIFVYPWWIYAVCIGGVIFLLLWLRSKFMII